MRRLLLAAIFLSAILHIGTPAKASYGHSAVIQQNGYPVFTVDEKPFFVYGAAFFYERIPKDRWRPSLAAYKAMGINTIDLYVMWNWHELRDGIFDFTGRTNPRRDLHSLLRLIHNLGFKTIVRPGPVIRNEWKNGGYPDWLLRRPEYNMPLHDVLEGRYPATATLQNAHSDDAAAEWLANKTHITYATRWLRRVFTEVRPWSSDVIAVALDDDQGAYIDNQTWPAPHFQTYVKYLDFVVHSATSPHVVTFINTYQMKVTASAPVWAWGNWYQSDAYSIGEHDRSQLDFSTGLLQTQPNYPVMVSEFQAGWLQGPDETRPRPADASNTALALHTMLQSGAHGIVNFPVQDTLNPAGYEAPFANMFYAWDAAIGLDGALSARYAPTAAFGSILRNLGPALAGSEPLYDAGIAYLTSAYDERELKNSDVYAIAAATIDVQKNCRDRGLSCELTDLRYGDPKRARWKTLILPETQPPTALQLNATARANLEALRAHGVRIISPAGVASLRPMVSGISNARVLAIRGRPAYLDVLNYGLNELRAPLVTIAAPGERAQAVKNVVVPARSGVLLPIQSLRPGHPELASSPVFAPCDCSHAPVAMSLAGMLWAPHPPFMPGAAQSIAYENDVLSDGFPVAFLQNSQVLVAVSPSAGGRMFAFSRIGSPFNTVTTIGALRDDVSNPPAPTGRDYIAKYTHQLPAGTFNRRYDLTIAKTGAAAVIRMRYTAPDLGAGGSSFQRDLTLDPDTSVVDVAEQFSSDDPLQKPVRLDSFTYTDEKQTRVLSPVSEGSQSGLGIFDEREKEFLVVTWPRADVLSAVTSAKPGTLFLRLTFARDRLTHTKYGLYTAVTIEAAQQILQNALKGR